MKKNDDEVIYLPLTPDFYSQVITLANNVHGQGYLDDEKLMSWVNKGIKNTINSSFVALNGNKLIGFRITYASSQWLIDKWCSPLLWNVDSSHCCYFKCNTVVHDSRGFGIGKKLLYLAVDAAKKQGAQAGISQLWKQSPNNSAVSYFRQCGGELVNSHPGKWNDDSKHGYDCVLCGYDCQCEAAEMIIYFR
jgi:GNAT superfamily N-acetyltransferase